MALRPQLLTKDEIRKKCDDLTSNTLSYTFQGNLLTFDACLKVDFNICKDFKITLYSQITSTP